MTFVTIAVACFGIIVGFGMGVVVTVRQQQKSVQARIGLIIRIRHTGKLLKRRVHINHEATIEQLATKLERLNQELVVTTQENADGTDDTIGGSPGSG